jgi:hypothetical protein
VTPQRSTRFGSPLAAIVHFFTGNKIGPRGDLASRGLHVRLEVAPRH